MSIISAKFYDILTFYLCMKVKGGGGDLWKAQGNLDLIERDISNYRNIKSHSNIRY